MARTRKTVSKQLGDDAKKARMEAWAAKLGLPKSIADSLISQYGPYAYTLMQKAMLRPSDIVDGGSSKNVVKKLISERLSSDKIAKLCGEKSALAVDNKLAQAQVEGVRRQAEEKDDPVKKKEKEEKKKADDKQKRVEKKADDKKKQEKPKAQEKPKEQEVAPQPTGNTITVDKVTLSTDPAKNYKDLENQAYQNFAKFEAKYPNFYLDCNLNPTIGIGHLTLPMSNLDSEHYHQKFLELPLVKKVGNKEVAMTKEEKETQYKFLRDQLKAAKRYIKQGYSKEQALAKTALGAKRIPGAGWELTSAQMTKGYLNENGMRQTFNSDFKIIYDEAKKNMKGLDSYPLPLQMAALHTVFNRGNSRGFAGKRTLAEVASAVNSGNEIKKDTVDAARVVCGLPMKYNKQNKLAYNRARQGGTCRA